MEEKLFGLLEKVLKTANQNTINKILSIMENHIHDFEEEEMVKMTIEDEIKRLINKRLKEQ